MTILQAVTVALIALIVTPGALFYFDITPKVLVLLCAAAACLIALPWTAFSWKPRWFAILAALTVLSLTLSTALSSNAALSLFGTNWRRFGAVAQVAVLLLAWMAASLPGAARPILRGIAVATALMAVYGILQYAGYDPFLPSAAYHVGEGVWTIVRPPGTLGYVSYFATWLAGAAFLCAALAGLETAPWFRRFAWSSGALALTALFLTGGRAGYLGVAAGAAVWAARRGFRLPRKAVVGLLAAAIALGAFTFSPWGWPVRSRARWFREDAWGGARLLLWRDSARMGLARWPAGFGPEVFSAAFPRFESQALARAYPDFAHESPHNMFLDALVAQGVAGPLLMAAFCLVALRGRNAFLAAALAAIVVSQQFTVFTVPTALLFYLTAALSAATVAAAVPGTRRPRLAWAAIPAALALLYAGVRLGVADAALASAQSRLQSGRISASLESWNLHRKWRLPGSSSGMWYSRALLNAGAIAQADAPSLDAARLAEDPFNAWYSRALVCAARNDAACVEQSLRAAIAARPNWYKPHQALSDLLRLQARVVESAAEAAKASFLANRRPLH